MRPSMRLAIHQSLTAIIWLAFHAPGMAQSETRLLPDSVAKAIAVRWVQDGRAVDVKVANPKGPWVITQVLLDVRFAPTQTPISMEIHRGKDGRAVWLPVKSGAKVEYALVEREPERVKVTVDIQPGKETALVHELRVKGDVVSVAVMEARGRPQTTFERVKSKVL